MSERERHVVDFYTRHPISAEHIMVRLRESHGTLDGLAPEALHPHDQDHYGGLEANAALADRAGMRPGAEVADFCAGLGGPARWWAHERGVLVSGVELNPQRAEGAQRLTRLVGLEDRVQVVQGDVLAPPFEDGAFDAVVSQEAFLHIPDKAGVLRQAFRILRPGGRLAFTDWVMHQPLSEAEAEDMWRGIAAQSLLSRPDYESLLRETGFEIAAVDDLTEAWGVILAERLEMFRRLREQARSAGAPSGDDAFFDSYVRLVDHVKAGKLGGARFAARRPG